MRNAQGALLAAVVLWVFATGCGGDDSSNATSAGGSAGAGGSGATAAGSGGAGTSTGGTTTGSGGSGGSIADAGAGCPSAQPAANTACDLDQDCTYGASICSCVDMLWTCTSPPPEGGAGCPMADPADGESCTVQGLICNYFGGLVCTCDRQTGWTCVQSARAR